MDSQKLNISELSEEKCQIKEVWGVLKSILTGGKEREKKEREKKAYTFDIVKYGKTT